MRSPVSLCGAWEHHSKGQWRRREDENCRWGTVVYDTVIALLDIGREHFYLDIYKTIEKEGDSEYEDLDHVSIAT